MMKQAALFAVLLACASSLQSRAQDPPTTPTQAVVGITVEQDGDGVRVETTPDKDGKVFLVTAMPWPVVGSKNEVTIKSGYYTRKGDDGPLVKVKMSEFPITVALSSEHDRETKPERLRAQLFTDGPKPVLVIGDRGHITAFAKERPDKKALAKKDSPKKEEPKKLPDLKKDEPTVRVCKGLLKSGTATGERGEYLTFQVFAFSDNTTEHHFSDGTRCTPEKWDGQGTINEAIKPAGYSAVAITPPAGNSGANATPPPAPRVPRIVGYKLEFC